MQSSRSMMLQEPLRPTARERDKAEGVDTLSADGASCKTAKACSLTGFALQALRKVPEVNASWNTDYIRQYHNIDVSVAVQTPGGLMVPIVHDADALGLSEISAKVKDLATKVSPPVLSKYWAYPI